MGSVESTEKEVEYNLLKDQVLQWDEADASQMKQIESFHQSIAMRSMGSHAISDEEKEDDEPKMKYQDPELYLQQQQISIQERSEKNAASDRTSREFDGNVEFHVMRVDESEASTPQHQQNRLKRQDGGYLGLKVRQNYMESHFMSTV